MNKSKKCIFCHLPNERIVYSTAQWVVVRDGYPISPGHALIIPNRHVNDYFDLNVEEYRELKTVMDLIKTRLDREYSPKGYNIGINCGEAAGQTVMHLHIHLIPRYQGDRDDPRGGVRWIIPEKADYWTQK